MDVELERQAHALIEVYFDCDSPSERDIVLDQLVALDTPSVTAFLRAMMAEDQDDVARAAAAAELARRGDAEAIAVLETDLADPEDLFAFENAVAGLCAARGPAFYDALRDVWHDLERDPEQCRQAMLAMESLDPDRALADFTAFVAGQVDPVSLADDQLELAIMAFVRHGHAPGRAELRALRDRIAGASGLEPGERDELLGLVQEALDLFDAGEAPASAVRQPSPHPSLLRSSSK